MKASGFVLLTALASALLVGGCKTTSPASGGASGGGMPAGGATGGASPGSHMPDSGQGGFPAPGSEPGGAGSSTDTPTGGPVGSDTTGGQAGAGSGRTVADMDGELDTSLEDFEGRVAGAGTESGTVDILDPSGRNTGGIAANVPVFEEAEVGSGDAGTIEDEEIATRASEGFEGAEEPADTVAASGGAGGAGEGGAGFPVPDDIGDGQGDDIVLRQIREAAMKEPDPVLRERLWDEYRRIKGQ